MTQGLHPRERERGREGMRRQVLTVTPPPIPTLLLEPGAVLPCPVAPQVTKSLSGCWGRLGLGAPQWPSSPLKGAGGRACEVPARLFCEWTSSLEEWNPRQSPLGAQEAPALRGLLQVLGVFGVRGLDLLPTSFPAARGAEGGKRPRPQPASPSRRGVRRAQSSKGPRSRLHPKLCSSPAREDLRGFAKGFLFCSVFNFLLSFYFLKTRVAAERDGRGLGLSQGRGDSAEL